MSERPEDEELRLAAGMDLRGVKVGKHAPRIALYARELLAARAVIEAARVAAHGPGDVRATLGTLRDALDRYDTGKGEP